MSFPFQFDSDVVFLAVDVEAFERAQDKITEIGISKLDTRDLVSRAPGPDGAAWVQQIRTRHFRIQEHAKLINKAFVKGCPDRFDFGSSEWLPLKSASTSLTSLFRIPSSFTAASPAVPESSTFRKIVLVGHGLSGDTGYLKALNFSPFAAGTVISTVDTLKLSGPKTNQLGLKRLLTALGVQPMHLHNAGNDAHYTMQALVQLAVRTLTTSEPLVAPRPIAVKKQKTTEKALVETALPVIPALSKPAEFISAVPQDKSTDTDTETLLEAPALVVPLEASADHPQPVRKPKPKRPLRQGEEARRRAKKLHQRHATVGAAQAQTQD